MYSSQKPCMYVLDRPITRTVVVCLTASRKRIAVTVGRVLMFGHRLHGTGTGASYDWGLTKSILLMAIATDAMMFLRRRCFESCVQRDVTFWVKGHSTATWRAARLSNCACMYSLYSSSNKMRHSLRPVSFRHTSQGSTIYACTRTQLSGH